MAGDRPDTSVEKIIIYKKTRMYCKGYIIKHFSKLYILVAILPLFKVRTSLELFQETIFSYNS